MKPMVRILTWLITTFAGIASAGGLLLSNLYRDADSYKIAWKANDCVTIFLLPIILASFNRSEKSQTAKVVWLGLVAYMFYNYSFYLFGTVFNWFFLLYVCIVTSSFYTLILAVISIQSRIAETSRPVPNRIWLVAFLLLTALPLAVVELKEYVTFIVSGQIPKIPVLILALDLSLIVPTAIVAAILLLLEHAWGYWLAGIMLVKSFAYGLVLVTGTVLISIKNLGPLDPLLPFYIFISAGGLISLMVLLHRTDNKLAI